MRKIANQLSGFIGNLLEIYDLMLCAYLAPIIAKTFLPQASTTRSLVNIFSILLVGYFARPIGGLVLGFLADLLGRKKILVISIVIMGASTALMGLLPGYSQIGLYATIGFIVLRFIQGISAGGEYISAIAFLVEHAPSDKKGIYTSWAAAGVNSGFFIACLFCMVFTWLNSMGYVPDYSWRFLFLISLVGIAVGLWARLNAQETVEFILENSFESSSPIKDLWDSCLGISRGYKKNFAVIIFLTWLGTGSTYLLFVYNVIHMQTVGGLLQQKAFLINTISLLIVIFLIPYFGWVFDLLGRRKTLFFATASFLILSIPYFYGISSGNFYQTLVAQIAMSIPAACFYCIAPVIIVEMIPTKIRCTFVSFLYGLTSSIFGGASPIIALKLVEITDNKLSPALYLIISCFAGFGAVYLLKTIGPERSEDDAIARNVLQFNRPRSGGISLSE